MSTASTRAINARIAESYDVVPYDPAVSPWLDPQRVLGLGSLYGCETTSGDVLDLGCGTGTQLERVGERVTGRLVGADLSKEACQKARRRCAKFGDRASILCSDLLDLNPSELGQFDLIYHIGVIFVTPPDVQRHILDLIAQCLKPGGVAVISYYAGSLPLLRASLHRTLRAVMTPGTAPGQAIVEARQRIAAIEDSLKNSTPRGGLLDRALTQTAQLSDVMFFHEVLNHAFDAMHTTEIDAHLTEHGVGFLNMLMPTAFGALATSKERALASDARDLITGSYHYAVFGRWSGERRSIDIRSPAVLWQSNLRREGGEPHYNAPSKFKNTTSELEVNVPDPLSQAFLDELQAGPASLRPTVERAVKRLEAKGLHAEEAGLEEAVVTLWNSGLLVPLRS